MIKINLFDGGDWCEDIIKNKKKYFDEIFTKTKIDEKLELVDPFNILDGNLEDLNHKGLEKVIYSLENLSIRDTVDILEIKDMVKLKIYSKFDEIEICNKERYFHFINSLNRSKLKNGKLIDVS